MVLARELYFLCVEWLGSKRESVERQSGLAITADLTGALYFQRP
jgi:hypothetical protein